MKLFAHRLMLTIFIFFFCLYACGQKPVPCDEKLLTRSIEINLAISDKRGIKASSGIIYLVENNLQTLTAYQKGTTLWKVNIGEMYTSPVVGTSEIRFIRLRGNDVFVVFGKHCYSRVNITNGQIKDLGCD
jgi:hypothetical protein